MMKNKKTHSILSLSFVTLSALLMIGLGTEGNAQAQSVETVMIAVVEKQNVPNHTAEFSKVNEKKEAQPAPAPVEAAPVVEEEAPAKEEEVAQEVEESPASSGASSSVQTAAEPEVVVTETPEEKPASPAPPAAPAPVVRTYTLSFLGQTIDYRPGGQSSGQAIIDQNPSLVSTWGGEVTGSTTDGLSSHFIGHNPGVFSSIFNLSIGSAITVTDGNGNARTYHVNKILDVNDYGVGVADGLSHWEELVGSGGGERIVLQTCINSEINRIVMAA